MAKKTHNSRYLLIDGNALVHRGFHAIPSLSTKSGEPTNAVYGFTMILLKAIKDLKPTHIACSFDLKGPTFRHQEYAEYKAHRVSAPDELYEQFDRVKEVVRALNIPIYEIEGFEADDVLGTMAKQICEHNKNECDVMIATGDLDTLQLVNKCVKVYTLRKGLTDTTIYDEAAVEERYGLTPPQMIDYKALRGDPSDNIKGVKGIGEKTAGDLIKEFGSLSELYKAIKSGKDLGDKIKPRPLKLLIEGEEDARMSYMLSTIITEVPIEVNIPPYEFTSSHLDGIMSIFQELEFRSLLDKLPKNYIPQKEVVEQKTPTSSGAIGKQDYQLIESISKLGPVLKKLAKQKEFVIDSETDQLNPIDAKVIGISLCWEEGEAYYVTADVISESKELQAILADPKIGKIGQNIKYDIQTLANSDWKLSPAIFDTMLASYLLDAGTRQHSLTNLAFNRFGYQMQPIEDLIGKGKGQISMRDVPVEKVSWYAAEDADITFRLKELLARDLKEEGLLKIFEEIEVPLVPVLARMERWGIKVDASLLEKLSKQAASELTDLESEIYKQAGEKFNINSPKQLQEILYEKLELTAGKKNKTGRSTAAGELEKLRDDHPIVDLILKYRELSKLQSTYLEALPKLVNARTNRIHTNYNQTIAATGRLSSIDPNLQNIPVKGDGLGSQIRQAFVAEDGFNLVALDYSQIELRIVAHLAKDKNMSDVFLNNGDIHTRTASAVFEVSEDKVTPDMRRDAKVINFGILYGLSSFGLSARISEVSQGSAKDFIDKYFEAYPEVYAFLEKTKMQVRENAFVTNELGRVRKFPEIKSSQYFIRQAAERAAVNFPIQSMNADIIKKAMIEIHELILGHDDEIRMLLQVHDELVFEIKQGEEKKWIKKLKPIMENSIKLSVPIIVEAKSGPNWGEM
ncbi:TPA: DNA polymerase I, partial [Patescibacteria group bacterium]|nr:DNA polymerase I [Patescibacteria group bacterium]